MSALLPCETDSAFLAVETAKFFNSYFPSSSGSIVSNTILYGTLFLVLKQVHSFSTIPTTMVDKKLSCSSLLKGIMIPICVLILYCLYSFMNIFKDLLANTISSFSFCFLSP